MARDPYLQIIESEKLIGGRFSNARRIDPAGGNGFFSLLLKARDQQTGTDVALKFFDPEKLTWPKRVERFHREVQMLDSLRSEPYVINLVDGLSTLQSPIVHHPSRTTIPLNLEFFAMEWADSNMERIIYGNDATALDSLLLFKEMIKATIRLHNRHICHRDLKPSNFLVSPNQICLSDLGTAKCMDGSMADISISYDTPIGDKNYIAPEVRFSLGIADEYVYCTDMFSMGAILFEMFTKTVLTSEIYTSSVLRRLLTVKAVMETMNERNKIKTYKGVADNLAREITLPDIFAYSDDVPKCIRLQLNKLYKDLAAINLFQRLMEPSMIHRRLDICIMTLRNEKKYQKWREQRRQRWMAKQDKIQTKLEN